MENIIARGRGGWASLPPLAWDYTWELKYRGLFGALSSRQMLIPTNSKANILVDKEGRARLAGFGLTTATRGNNPVTGHQDPNPIAAPTWAAPELSKGGIVTDEGDIFALAVVIFEVRIRSVLIESS